MVRAMLEHPQSQDSVGSATRRRQLFHEIPKPPLDRPRRPRILDLDSQCSVREGPRFGARSLSMTDDLLARHSCSLLFVTFCIDYIDPQSRRHAGSVWPVSYSTWWIIKNSMSISV
jgi:hypothetical protein